MAGALSRRFSIGIARRTLRGDFRIAPVTSSLNSCRLNFRWVKLMRHLFTVLACALALLFSVVADAESIGINFRRSTGQQNMDPSESAGVTPQVNWNNTDGAASGNGAANISGPTVNSLTNSSGAVVPGLSFTWTANGTWSAPNSGPGDLNLMSGYLDDTGTAGDTVITVTGVPFAFYDVYAYVGSDANNRSGRTRLHSFFANDRWFRTSTSPFTGFTEATATAEPASNTGLANYSHYRSLNTSSFELRVLRGSNNVGLHGIQIVETDGSSSPNWMAAPTAAPASPAPLAPALDSIGLNFIGGRANTAEPDGHVEDDGIVTGVAGVPAVAQANWNNLAGPTGTAAAGTLVSKGGQALAGTNVTWSSANSWTISTADAVDQDAALMKGYLDTTNTSTTTVTVTDLPAEWTEYDVYVYIDGDATAGRAGNYTISTVTDGSKTATVSDTANWNLGTAGGAFTRANENANDMTTNPGFTSGNYLVFTGLHDLTFTLTAQGSLAGASPPRAPINAIQIVATQVVPEPTSIGMLALGAMMLAARRKR